MEVPGRIEMRAVVGGELHLLDRPALPVRQIFRLQPVEELQHPRQALLVIDVLDGRMPARRIGRHVVLQGNGDIDQFARHGVSSLDVLVVLDVAGSGLLPLDPVLQDADLFDFELDGVAMLEIPAEFEAAAIADGAGADEFAGHQGLVLGDMGDDLLERE